MLASVRRAVRIVAIVLVPALALEACYKAVPIEAAPPPDTEIVLELTSDATQQLGGFLGRGTASARGRLISWESDSVIVAMLATENTRGEEQLWRRERVGIPRDAIARVRERRLQRGRTTALVIAGSVVIVSALVLAMTGQGGSSGGGTKPVPQ